MEPILTGEASIRKGALDGLRPAKFWFDRIQFPGHYPPALAGKFTLSIPASQFYCRWFVWSTKEQQLFTGLVEEKGVIKTLERIGTGCELTIAATKVSSDAQIGDSIAINGCCLTVVRRNDDQLTFEAGSETLHRTNLGSLVSGDFVNLERSLQVGQRMGGHYVSGHIDGIGKLTKRTMDGPWANLWFSVDPSLARQMASKGSVAVDGISLTLVDVEQDGFSVALIPHTLDITTLGGRKVGDTVNIETDLLAKYVQQQLATEI